MGYTLRSSHEKVLHQGRLKAQAKNPPPAASLKGGFPVLQLVDYLLHTALLDSSGSEVL